MGAIANLGGDFTNLKEGLDSIVIRNYVGGVAGGRTLDVSDYTLDVINAGHVVIKETATDVYKPMPLNSENNGYGSLPEGHEYVGVVVCSKPKTEPLVGIMHSGEVNDEAGPFSLASIKQALKAAVPTLVFMHD